MIALHETLCIGLGIVAGMLYYQRTGFACGGIITPGFLALSIWNPLELAMAFTAGILTFALLKGVVRLTGLYGRQRLATAMLIALGLKIPLSVLTADTSLWLGWVVPGLIGADMEKQGVTPTLIAVVSTGMAAAMAVQLITTFIG